MKNNRIIYIVIFLISLGSCSDDFLQEKKNYDDYEEDLFKTEVATDWYVSSLYYQYYSSFRSPVQTLVGSFSDDKTKMTDEIGGTVGDFIHPAKNMEEAAQASNYYGVKIAGNIANNPYTRIRNCNILIEKSETVGRGSLSDTYIDKVKGQAYFLRAIQYFDLVRTYGGVPLVLEVQNISASDPTTRLPRAKTSECFVQIVKDLEIAAELLPESWSEYGKFTKYAAIAMKSRVLLTAASPLFNKDWDNSGNERWKAALEAGLEAERQLSGAGYDLYGNSAKDWDYMFYGFDNKFCKEVIMVQLLASVDKNGINNSWENAIRLTSQSGGGGIAAPKEMIDLFPMADGKRPTSSNKYDEVNFFLNRDPRFYRTFAFNGYKWGYKNNENNIVWAYRYEYVDKGKVSSAFSGGNQIKSPAFVRKMTDPNIETFKFSGTDIYEYRYAELLLNIAECYAATGDIANAVKYLGRIRNRVGIPVTNNYGIGTLTSKYQAIEACLYERRVELAYEGKRFWDLQRWMLYNKEAGTTTKLGIKELNGTCRTGHYMQAIDQASSKADPLEEARKHIVIDPNANDFQNQLQALAEFNQTYLKRVDLDSPLDGKVNNEPATILWRQNYYISGLTTTVLDNNPWITQTKGWLDSYGGQGIFDYQE